MHSEKSLHDKFDHIAECCRKVRRTQETMREVSRQIEQESRSGVQGELIRGASPVIPPKGRT